MNDDAGVVETAREAGGRHRGRPVLHIVNEDDDFENNTVDGMESNQAQSRRSESSPTETMSDDAATIAKVESDRFQRDGHHARFPHSVTEARSIVLHVSSSMNEAKKDDEVSEDGEEEGGTAAARKNDEISRKDAEIRRLIESRISTPKEEKQRVKYLSKSIKKMYQREEKTEKTTRNPKKSRRLQESKLHKRKCSLQRLRMNEEKSLHNVKGSPMSLVFYEKLYGDNE